MRVALLGASGFIGKRLTAALTARGDAVEALSLRDPATAAVSAAQCDAVVNLAGEPVAQRWSATVKHRIEYSRTEAPRQFLERLGQQSRRPGVYVSASAIGYYGTSEATTFDETSPPGNDFLARVCVEWEAEASHARDLGLRVAMVRCGLVLDPDGGALAKMLPPFRAGIGGVVGSGKQWISWIHVDDVTRIYELAIDRAEGAIDATAPNPVTNATLTHSLGAALKRPTVAPVPKIALRLMLGEGAYILLEGQRVLPKRLLDEYGFEFRFPEIDAALRHLFDRDAKL
ncbi:MAG TPA: TIGR01777 family oxidoreductase [Candidatus Baltobacteraceae bacterium]|nr:TIGR01777 family oxidoreductase [Candidatus Baltobacteraceae bacterium]